MSRFHPRALPGSTLAGLMVLVAASLWGTAGVASRWIHEAGTATALEIGFWRLTLAVPLLLLIARMVGPIPKHSIKTAWPTLLLMGVCLAGFQVGYFSAIGALGVAVATLLAICTIPILAALLAWPWYGEPITPSLTVSLLTATLGAGLVVLGSQAPDIPGAGGLAVGLPMALAASACFAVLTLAGRRIPGDCPPLWSASLTLSIAALLLGLVAWSDGPSFPENLGGTWLAMAWIALLPTAVAYALFYMGVSGIRSSTAGMLILAEPLTANLLAWLLHAERLGGLGWLGAILLLSAMGLMAWQAGGRARGHPE